MSNRWAFIVCGFLMIGFSHSMQAQFPEGPEFQVDTLTTNPEVIVDSAKVATAPDGRSVVVWRSSRSAGTDVSSVSIQGRLYAPDGSPLGDSFQVNTFTTGEQNTPNAAMAPNGDFIVVWGNPGTMAGDPSRGIHGQRFSSAGTPQGNPFQMPDGVPTDPSVAMDEDGAVVIWHSTDIRGQRFASDGSLLGDQLQINSYTSGTQSFADVAMDPNGGFIVAWTSDISSGNDDSEASVQGRRFASDGSPLGEDFQVNSYTTGPQWFPLVAVDGEGEFIVVWEGDGAAGSGDIQGRRFASDGSPRGGELQISASTASLQGSPDVAMDERGNFMVVWDRLYPTVSEGAVFGRQFVPDGTPLDDPFRIESEVPGGQSFPTVAERGDGKFVVAWQSYYYKYGGISAYNHIQGQRFQSAFFADGFESGDTAAWSATFP